MPSHKLPRLSAEESSTSPTLPARFAQPLVALHFGLTRDYLAGLFDHAVELATAATGDQRQALTDAIAAGKAALLEARKVSDNDLTADTERLKVQALHVGVAVGHAVAIGQIVAGNMGASPIDNRIAAKIVLLQRRQKESRYVSRR